MGISALRWSSAWGITHGMRKGILWLVCGASALVFQAGCKRTEESAAKPAEATGDKKETAVSTSDPAPAAVTPASRKAPVTSFATVDFARVFRECKLFAETQERYKTMLAEVNKGGARRAQFVKKLLAEQQVIQRRLDTPNLAVADRLKWDREMAFKREEVAVYERERKEYVDRRTKALKQKLDSEVQAISKVVRKRVNEQAAVEGYSCVIDRSGVSKAFQFPVVVYARTDLPDITDAVVKTVNQDVAKEMSTQ